MLTLNKYTGIYIDTSSVMRRAEFSLFIREFLSTNMIRFVTIPYAVINELKHIENKYPKRASEAHLALERIGGLASSGKVLFFGSPYDTERPDAAFVNIAALARSKGEKPLFITQDYQLARDLLELNKIKSTFAPALNVKRINSVGELESFDLSVGATLHKSNTYFKPKTFNGTKDVLKRFGIIS